MAGVSWGTGHAEFRRGRLLEFYDDGVCWYDATRCIARPDWRERLEPYEGEVIAMSFAEGIRFGLKYYGWRRKARILGRLFLWLVTAGRI